MLQFVRPLESVIKKCSLPHDALCLLRSWSNQHICLDALPTRLIVKFQKRAASPLTTWHRVSCSLSLFVTISSNISHPSSPVFPIYHWYLFERHILVLPSISLSSDFAFFVLRHSLGLEVLARPRCLSHSLTHSHTLSLSLRAVLVLKIMNADDQVTHLILSNHSCTSKPSQDFYIQIFLPVLFQLE